MTCCVTKKHAGTNRSLFSLDDNSQEQLAGMVKKSMGKFIVFVHTKMHLCAQIVRQWHK